MRFFVMVAALACVAGQFTMLGADMSSVEQAQRLGAVFRNVSGVADDPYKIIKYAGANYVRLRVWNNPVSGQCNTEQVVAAAKKAKAVGHKILIDFHYSDTWADPDHQTKPVAWTSHTIDQLTKDVYNFTFSVCQSLVDAGATPDSVQIGNEINTGMLWTDGRTDHGNYGPLSELLKQGYKATKDCNSNTQVIIHTATIATYEQARAYYDNITAVGVEWDITGLSYYCWAHGSIANMKSVVSKIKSRYNKPVCLMETSYPFTTKNADFQPNTMTKETPCPGYNSTIADQARFFKDVQTGASEGGGAGVFYWEPAWIAVAGNGWDPDNTASGDTVDNQAGFSFDHVWQEMRWGA